MNCAVFVSDKRMLYLIQILKNAKFDVDKVECEKDLRHLKKKTYDFIVLPVKGVSDTGFIFNNDIGYYITDFLMTLKPNTLVFTGKDGYVLKNHFTNVVNYLDDQSVLDCNSKLTAQGLLASIIWHTSKSIFDYNYLIIGYGMCGKYIVELFDNLKLEFTIITSSNKNSDFKYKYIKLEQIENVDNTIIINTAPICVINEDLISKFKTMPIIFDLSTNNVGVDDVILKRYKDNCYYLPALPSKYSPYSAANCIADKLIKEILN